MNTHITVIVILLISTISSIVCLRGIWEKEKDEIVPDYGTYYYNTIEEKLLESLSVSNCTAISIPSIHSDDKKLYIVSDHITESSDRYSSISTDSRSHYHIYYETVSPPPIVTSQWGTLHNEIHSIDTIYYRVTRVLCTEKKFSDFTKGQYKRSKGCYQMTVLNVTDGTYTKRINRYGATLHPDHIRCHNELFDMNTCIDSSVDNNTSSSTAITTATTIYTAIINTLRTFHEYPFLIKISNAVVSRSGMVGMLCGPFGLFASCEAVKHGVYLANETVEHVQECHDSLYLPHYIGNGCKYPIIDRVFVMTQYDDTQIGQFILEALPKLIYHLQYLYDNPDVKIHYGFTKKPTVPAWVVPHTYFQWLGLADRIINGTFYAKHIMIPREGGCQDVSYNAWEALNQREVLLQLAGINDSDIDSAAKDVGNRKKRTILILKRTSSKYTQNKTDLNVRRWPNDVFTAMTALLQIHFPNHEINIYSDQQKELMHNPALQIQLFNQADILIAIHGAGMTNSLYMKPNSIVVEVLPYFDSRLAPVIGIFPRLSQLVGLHHYSYAYGSAWDGFLVNSTHLVESVKEYAIHVGII